MSLFRRRAAAAHELLLLTRPGCHLCHKARAAVDRVAAELGVEYREIDITTDAALHDRYKDAIPVTLVDGAPVDQWHVNEERLRRALTAR
ncbi:NrdH-redoxin [Mangrovactinospora gilvigrisea]|uniref:NrdH-redoxin n=1 Tax=Mangrovactinospora gilvigrisea TaxID=1428644 RepID=A0A1J7B9M0_9ACTN|nr:glutaredoxin family protein [Mangrovactinospora gilvigrisea]OIV35293.1 NrdH-redoxin [Mangrovactinospora gilvigrisea]